MKKITIIFCFLLLAIATINGQNNNQSEKWFLGIEVGSNPIKTSSLNYEKKASLGFFSEYYYTKNFSVTLRIKKYQSGFYEYTHVKKIKSDILAMPINLKWEFTLIKNLHANVNLGLTFITEMNIEYESTIIEPPTSKEATKTLNSGIGCTYFISNKLGIYLNYENNLGFGTAKSNGKNTPLFLYEKDSSHLNFGIKYRMN